MCICFDEDNRRGPDDDGALLVLSRILLKSITLCPTAPMLLSRHTDYLQSTIHLSRTWNVCIENTSTATHIHYVWSKGRSINQASAIATMVQSGVEPFTSKQAIPTNAVTFKGSLFLQVYADIVFCEYQHWHMFLGRRIPARIDPEVVSCQAAILFKWNVVLLQVVSLITDTVAYIVYRRDHGSIFCYRGTPYHSLFERWRRQPCHSG